jgi:hypothetical protein
MATITPTPSRGSFRVPNSVVQGLTTTTPTDLNRLTAFQMVTLFGLMAHVSSKHPRREVRLRVAGILEIVRVSKSVTGVVGRTWTTKDGQQRRREYPRRRYSPKHLEQVHDALLALYNQSVVIRRRDGGPKREIKERIVHILDSFGYCYEAGGHPVDVDDLPPDREKVNIGTGDRPVWRIRRRTSRGERYERPAGVLYRINSELADELINRQDTIGFTVFARRVFELFRAFAKAPAAVRLLITVLRQTGGDFTRVLGQLLDDLGWDTTHPARAIAQLEQVLERLRRFEVVADFAIDREADRITITTDRTWFQETGKVF